MADTVGVSNAQLLVNVDLAVAGTTAVLLVVPGSPLASALHIEFLGDHVRVDWPIGLGPALETATTLDPMAYSHDDPRNARVVIDACKPWARRDSFPIEARSSKELDARIRAKFAGFLPKGA